jgi:hypothetical protein
LYVPPNALRSDTTVQIIPRTVDPQTPNSLTVRGSVYELGPSGTVFSPAATLTLPLVATPSGSDRAVISYLDPSTNQWVDQNTTAGSGTVAAAITQLGRYAVRFVDINSVGDPGFPIGGSCAVSPCGGDLTGQWNVSGACLQPDRNLLSGYCSNATFSAQLTASGTLGFTAGRYTVNFRVQGTYNAALPSTCVNRSGVARTCDSVWAELGATSCSGDSNSGCTCNGSLTGTPATSPGSWSSSGSTLTITQDSGGQASFPYCVSGNQLRIDLGGGQILYLSR